MSNPAYDDGLPSDEEVAEREDAIAGELEVNELLDDAHDMHDRETSSTALTD